MAGPCPESIGLAGSGFALVTPAKRRACRFRRFAEPMSQGLSALDGWGTRLVAVTPEQARQYGAAISRVQLPPGVHLWSNAPDWGIGAAVAGSVMILPARRVGTAGRLWGRRMEITQLRHFVVAAQQQSLSKAAEELGQSVSALSRSIKRLEQTLGNELFTRTAHGFELSERGATLLEYAKKIVQEHDHALVALRVGPPAETGVMRVGAVRYLVDFGIPAAVARFLQRYPNFGMEIVDHNFEELIRQLRSDDLDVVVAPSLAPLTDSDISFEPVVQSNLIYAVGASHPLAKRQIVTEADICRERMIISNRPAAIRTYYRQFWKTHEPVASHAVIVTSPALARQLLLTGDFVAVVSRHSVAGDLQTGRLVELPHPVSTRPFPVGIFLRGNGVLSTPTFEFLNELRAALRNAASEDPTSP